MMEEILVVDDEPTFLSVLILLLVDWGYEVDAAKSVAEAFSKVV